MLKGKNYCITWKNLPAHELIGLQAEVTESTDRERKGIKGMIVDETKNLLVIETGNGEKKVPKREVTLKVKIGEESKDIDCSELQHRPEDRIKYWREGK